jgi:subtilisin family serine protease
MSGVNLQVELGIPTVLIRSLGIEACTGKGTRVVIVDSGIADGHPHVGRLEQGVRLERDDFGGIRLIDDRTDTIGHGTACTGVVRAIAPESRITSVKILDDQLKSSSDLLVEAIEWAIGDGRADVINLSLGTENREAVQPLQAACGRARDADVIIVAAARDDRRVDYPANLPYVIGVTTSSNGLLYSADHPSIDFYAPSYPRTIPGRAREDNFQGPSFSAARITGIVALMIEAEGRGDIELKLNKLRHYIPLIPASC